MYVRFWASAYPILKTLNLYQVSKNWIVLSLISPIYMALEFCSASSSSSFLLASSVFHVFSSLSFCFLRSSTSASNLCLVSRTCCRFRLRQRLLDKQVRPHVRSVLSSTAATGFCPLSLGPALCCRPWRLPVPLEAKNLAHEEYSALRVLKKSTSRGWNLLLIFARKRRTTMFCDLQASRKSTLVQSSTVKDEEAWITTATGNIVCKRIKHIFKPFYHHNSCWSSLSWWWSRTGIPCHPPAAPW